MMKGGRTRRLRFWLVGRTDSGRRMLIRLRRWPQQAQTRRAKKQTNEEISARFQCLLQQGQGKEILGRSPAIRNSLEKRVVGRREVGILGGRWKIVKLCKKSTPFHDGGKSEGGRVMCELNSLRERGIGRLVHWPLSARRRTSWKENGTKMEVREGIGEGSSGGQNLPCETRGWSVLDRGGKEILRGELSS